MTFSIAICRGICSGEWSDRTEAFQVPGFRFQVPPGPDTLRSSVPSPGSRAPARTHPGPESGVLMGDTERSDRTASAEPGEAKGRTGFR